MMIIEGGGRESGGRNDESQVGNDERVNLRVRAVDLSETGETHTDRQTHTHFGVTREKGRKEKML